MGRITVIGSINTDLIILSDKIPVIGETVIGNEFHMMGGGKGANQAIAIKRLGGAVDFVCCVGDDLYGENMIKSMAAEGFNLQHVKKQERVASGIAMIMVDRQAQNCILVAPGANAKLSADLIDAVNPFSDQTAFLLMQLEIPLESVQYATAKARERGIKVVLNAAPAQKLSPGFLSKLDMLIINETEACILTDTAFEEEYNIEELCQKLNAQGIDTIVVTLGAKGTYVYEADGQFHVPAFSVEALDTTAAGDTFCGALTYYLSQGKGLEESVVFANAAAAIAVTRLGAQQSIPVRKEVEHFLGKVNQV